MDVYIAEGEAKSGRSVSGPIAVLMVELNALRNAIADLRLG